MPTDFVLERVVVHSSRDAEGARLDARILESLPEGVPTPQTEGTPAYIFDVSLTADSQALPVNTVIFQFLVDPGWLSSNCPATSCRVALLHWTGSAWETLLAERHETRSDGRIAFAAVSHSLSPFVVAGVPASASGFEPVGDGGPGRVESLLPPGTSPAALWPALLVLGLVLLVVSILLIRKSRQRKDPPAPPPPLPPPKIMLREREDRKVRRAARSPRSTEAAQSGARAEPELDNLFGMLDEA